MTTEVKGFRSVKIRVCATCRFGQFGPRGWECPKTGAFGCGTPIRVVGENVWSYAIMHHTCGEWKLGKWLASAY